jgi:hypothetical protein
MRCAGAMKEPLRQCTGSGTPALCHAQDVRSTLGRDELFAALVILGFANGTVKMVSQAISVDGLWAALPWTTDIKTQQRFEMEPDLRL